MGHFWYQFQRIMGTIMFYREQGLSAWGYWGSNFFSDVRGGILLAFGATFPSIDPALIYILNFSKAMGLLLTQEG